MRRLLLASTILALWGSQASAQPFNFDLYHPNVTANVPITGNDVAVNGSSSTSQSLGGQSPTSWTDMANFTPGSTKSIFNEGVGGSTQSGGSVFGQVDSAFTASISGTVMTVTACTACTIQVGQGIQGTGVGSTAAVSSIGTFNGVSGTVNVSPSQGTVVSTSMTGSATNVYKKIFDSVNNISAVTDRVNGISGISGARLNATRIIQVDPNGTIAPIGGPENNFAWMAQNSVTGGSSVNNQLMDLFPTTVSQNRYLFWMASDGGWTNGLIWNDRRFERLLWQYYPGHVQNEDQVFMERWGSIRVADVVENSRNVIPHSADIPDLSHMATNGNVFLDQQVFLPFVQGVEGSVPWCADHRYFGNASTAQTLNGDTGISLKCIGTPGSDVHFSIVNLDHSPSVDFKLGTPTASNGLTSIPVSRASATVLKNGYYDQNVRVWTDAGQNYYWRVRLGIGSTGLCNCDTMALDGYEPAETISTDNQGTAALPVFALNTTRVWRSTGAAGNVPGGLTGFTWVARITLDSTDTYPGTTNNRIINLWTTPQIRRIASGAVDMFWTGDGGGTASSVVSGTGDGCSGNPGKSGIFDNKTCDATHKTKWLIFTVDMTGTCYQRSMLINDADAVVDWDSGAAACTGTTPTTILQNPIFTNSAGFLGPGAGQMAGILWSATGSGDIPYQSVFSGKIARLMIFPYAIDFTAGATFATKTVLRAVDCSACTNLAALRAGAGTLTDFGVASSAVVGDGRSIITVAGGGPGGTTWSAGHVGTATPWFGLSGNAADYHQGLSIGSAADTLPGDEPGNAAKVGGVQFEVNDRRNWQNQQSTQGLAITQ